MYLSEYLNCKKKKEEIVFEEVSQPSCSMHVTRLAKLHESRVINNR